METPGAADEYLGKVARDKSYAFQTALYLVQTLIGDAFIVSFMTKVT